ncbi:MAG: UDP-N-acetylmuramoyl-L-alanyl-D-glutamate--2,6-diaminopimelate ligase [Epsilonproteobacteria bacterium]|nr:UDP-N-acetylmuramoyl-L-alanyl-D-glutamate--2,6-diaminopimelate ligase [Campylobacterota bacterium]
MYKLDENSFISEDSREIKEGVYFLKSAQNKKYINTLPSNSLILTPKELIKKWGLDSLNIIGITGTNGKTTTAAIIYSILNDLGEKAALQGTRGFFVDDERVEDKSLTTPSILQTLYNMKRAKERGAKYFVMEVSSHAIDQNRIEDINFALKIFTNVTQDHLDYHKSIEEYRAVKSRFFLDESLKLINKDEAKKIVFNEKNAYTYALDEAATFKVEAFSLVDGITGAINYLYKEMATFHSPLRGLFNVYNITAAVGGVKLLTNRPLDEICEVVENFGGVSGRMEVVSTNPTIIVDFAHTPDGMFKVLDSIRDKDIVVVFGAGGDRDRDKRGKMGLVAAKFAKRIYITSDNPRSEEPEAIIEEIAKPIEQKEGVEKIVDRKEAIFKAVRELDKEREVLLILGKGDESYIEIKDKKIPFDDREVAKEALEAIRS